MMAGPSQRCLIALLGVAETFFFSFQIFSLEIDLSDDLGNFFTSKKAIFVNFLGFSGQNFAVLGKKFSNLSTFWFFMLIFFSF